jgi:Mce-associated membrane protein
MTTTPTVTPSWYDVLDIELGSSETEVRAAWKSAIADLEPTDRRFRLLNQAAEVLLDRDRRTAYDTQLLTAELDAHLDESALAESSPDEEVSTTSTGAGSPSPARVVPGWLLVVVAAMAALVVGACAVVASTAPSDASIADATPAAQTSAERAIVPILSYDGSKQGDLDEDQRAAEGFLTAEYRDEYAKLFEVIKANAPETGTKVAAEVVASGIVRSGDDRVAVLVFVNRPTTNKQVQEPVVYKDQVTVTMQKVGDEWLVDDLMTSPAAG